MISKEHIEQLLYINGVEPSSPDDEIKSVLIRARWNEDDVDTAITILRENKNTHERSLQTENIFASDNKMSPETITSLLGISTDISGAGLLGKSIPEQRKITLVLLFQIFTVALFLLTIVLLFTMWSLQIGPFHQSGALYNLTT